MRRHFGSIFGATFAPAAFFPMMATGFGIPDALIIFDLDGLPADRTEKLPSASGVVHLPHDVVRDVPRQPQAARANALQDVEDMPTREAGAIPAVDVHDGCRRSRRTRARHTRPFRKKKSERRRPAARPAAIARRCQGTTGPPAHTGRPGPRGRAATSSTRRLPIRGNRRRSRTGRLRPGLRSLPW